MIRTTAGDIEPPLTGIILPHEHIHTDLLPLSEGGDRKVSTSVIRQAVEQKLRRAVRAGVALLIECTPPYVGQNVEAVAEVGEATRLPVVVATGLYKESFQPPWALNASVSEISDWMMRDLEEGIDGTDVRAGFIKLAVTDGGVTSQEGNVLRAAIEVSNRTGAAIASHSPVGSNAVHQLKTIEQAGGDTSRYIQVHAHAELRFDVHLDVLRRGAWIEYDGIGGQLDSLFVDLVRKVFDAGFGHRLLLSQDVCGYLVDRQSHSDDSEYAYFVDTFLPALSDAGVSAPEIDRLVRTNPAEAFSIDSG